MGGVGGAKGGLAGQDDGDVIEEPPLHFLIGLSSEEKPAARSPRPEVGPVPGVIPGDASGSRAQEAIPGQGGDENDVHKE